MYPVSPGTITRVLFYIAENSHLVHNRWRTTAYIDCWGHLGRCRLVWAFSGLFEHLWQTRRRKWL